MSDRLPKDMLTRVNYAIMQAFFAREPDQNGDRVFTISPADNEDLARAAIEALRDPPIRLVAAALDDHDKRGGRQGYTDAWNAMIDAALKEGAP